MTVSISNTELTNTFEYWRARTNELADAMSVKAVTVDSNTAAGNAAITGRFGADSVSVGNSTVNVVITTPNNTQISSGEYVLLANGQWAFIDALDNQVTSFQIDTSLDVDGTTTANTLIVTGSATGNTLSLSGNFSTNGSVVIDGTINANGNVIANNDLTVNGNTTLQATVVNGASDLKGAVIANSTLVINGTTTANAATFKGAVTANSTLVVNGTTTANAATYKGAVVANSTLVVNGATTANAATFKGAVVANTSLTVNGATTANAATFKGAMVANSTLTVNGTTTANSTLVVNGATTANAATFKGAVVANSTLTVNGTTTANAATFKGAVVANSDLTVNGSTTSGNTLISGTASIIGDITAFSNLTVNGSTTSGNTLISGTASIKGNVSANSDLTVNGNTTVNNFVVSGTFDVDTITITGTTTANDVSATSLSATTVTAGNIVANNNPGPNGYILMSNGAGIYWGPPVDLEGDILGVSSFEADIIYLNSLSANSSNGSSGQFLRSNGVTPYWDEIDFPVTNDNNSNNIYYVALSAATTGNVSQIYVSSDGVSYDTDTKTLIAGNIQTGSYTGNAEIETTSHIVSGLNSGGVSLTINDGYGDANITWNHKEGTPEQNGNSARITVNTDNTLTPASMVFQLDSGTTSGVAAALNNVMTLTETAITAASGVNFVGDLTGTASNADKLDNINSSQFLRSDISDTFTGDLTVNGGVTVNNNISANGTLTVNGTSTLKGAVTANNNLSINGSTTANSVTIKGTTTANGDVVTNNNLTVKGAFVANNTATINGSTTANNVTVKGTLVANNTLTVNGTTSANVVIVKGALTANAGATVNGNITVTGLVDGRDVASDGSKLDGIESGATADQTASEILTAIKTLDGSGSGLDADLLDGQQGSYYQPTSTALKTSTTFSGDVSGTYNAMVVANDSHTHDGRYYTETEIDTKLTDGTVNKLANATQNQTGNFHMFVNDGGGNIGMRWNSTTGANNSLVEDGIAYELEVSNDSSTGDFTINKGSTSTGTAGETITWTEAFRIEGSQSELYAFNNKIWHAGNDGSGSGLDADTVDGIQATNFLRSDTSDSMSGSLTVTGDVSAANFNSTSDEKLKENIRPINNSLELLNSIDVYSFNWKESGMLSYGVIAQELEKVIPELVSDRDGTKHVNYLPLIALLIQGFKELSEKLGD